MEIQRRVPQHIVKKVKTNPQNFGLAYKELGKYTDFSKYSIEEINEMYFGIYKHKQTLLVDGDYFLDLNLVTQAICELQAAAYYKKPSQEDFLTNNHNSISNIRTFYIRDYFLITESEVCGKKRHKITNYLNRIGVLRNGRGEYAKLYSYRNHYNVFQSFKNGNVPKDLFHPIKRNINGQFFNNDYKINDFILKSDFEIEKHNK